jgi:hypothetical protein
MGVNLGTVEALLHRARRALKREFDTLAGPETVPAAVGGGLLVRLARRLQGLRARVPGWDEAWAPMLGNAVVATVLAVGAGLSGGGAVATQAATVASVVAVSDGVASSPDVESAGPAADRAPRHAAGRGAEAGAGSTWTPGTEKGPGLFEVPGDEGRERTNDNPIQQTVDGVGDVGADPQAVVDDSRETAERWADWATGGSR